MAKVSLDTGTITPPSDTMKYDALTYDDEGEIFESVEDCEVISINSKKICGAFIKKVMLCMNTTNHFLGKINYQYKFIVSFIIH